MIGLIKICIIVLLGLYLLLTSTKLNSHSIMILENIWVSVYSVSSLYFNWVDDVLLIFLSFLVVVVAACEVVILVSLFYLDSRK